LAGYEVSFKDGPSFKAAARTGEVRPFRIGPWTATPDDSGERDGWWIEELFVPAESITKLRRVLERIEASEQKRSKRPGRGGDEAS
jgi:hypothetical protein